MLFSYCVFVNIRFQGFELRLAGVKVRPIHRPLTILFCSFVH